MGETRARITTRYGRTPDTDKRRIRISARYGRARIIRAVPNWVPRDDHDPIVDLGKATIGAAVRARRHQLGWPQRWLAFQAHVSQPVISRLETGALNGIRWQTLARIVGVLGAGRGLELPTLADWQRFTGREDWRR